MNNLQFKKVNYEDLKLTPSDTIPSHIRMVESGSSLANLVKQPQQDFLSTALENCRKFNDKLEGTIDK